MLIKSLLLTTILSLANLADAGVITFEGAATNGCQVTAGGQIDGFTLGAYNGTVGAGFDTASDCSFVASTAHSGTKYALNYNSVVGQVSKDVGDFTLNSLWVHPDDRVAGDTTVRFNAFDDLGALLFSLQDVFVQNVWQQVSFVGWNNIKSFTWDPISPNVSNIAIDDIAYNQNNVPEPATGMLLCIGIAGMTLRRRMRRN